MADDGGGDEETGDATTSEQEDGGRRILFLDAYDSFINNIVALLKETLGSHVAVHVRHMDLRPLDGGGAAWTAEELEAALTSFDAVVCGPGPGTPAREADVGAFARLWAGDVPVLGICLGFQSLAAHLGADIRRLRRGGLHGMVRAIDHGGEDVFDGVPAFRATLYHSLTAYVGQDAVRERDWPTARWERPAAAPELVPLAWARDLAEGDGDGGGAERILMAARHASRPLWGIQYHPESVCTEPAARLVVRNWFRRALEWNTATRRRVDGTAVWADSLDPAARRWPGPGPEPDRAGLPWLRDMQTGLAATAGPSAYACRQMRLPAGVDTADVAQALGLDAAETLILDSSSTVSGDPLARSSILALDAAEALRVEYRVGDAHVTLRLPATRRRAEQSQQIRLAGQGAAVDPSSPWHVVSELWRRRRTPDATAGPGRSPAFRGGFVGFVTYEMGLSTLSPGLTARDRRHRRPDVCLVWVTKSLVLDHRAGLAWLQALPSPDDGDAAAWLDTMAARLQHSSAWREGSREGSRDAAAAGRPSCAHGLLRDLDEHCNDDGNDDDHGVRFRLPPAPEYERDVRRCQAAIRDGESYELCLTAQTLVTRPAAAHGDGASAWHLFCRLRRSQPAPFGSFVRLGGLTLISSSPECFLTHDVAGTCSMRPMKGTVRKSEAVSSLAEAKKILHVPKEEAENLMIVDLVRHDLHGVCGPGAVSVPELLRVEEYATVFQMSTVVRGQLPVPLPTSSTHVALTGFDVLAAALPPGSMTGAPKKRSCELLHALEPGERSVYAGVVGYLDVAGQADWSVTIRAMFRWDDEVDPGTDKAAPRREVWRIGAGGAVTTLSTPADERDEMFTKLSGPLAVLYDAA